MTKYESLVTKAEKSGAKVIEVNFGTNKKCGKCIDNLIFINSNLQEKDKLSILAEELGHYKTTYGNITKQSTISDKKQEFKARRWGHKHIVSLEGIVEAIEHNCINRFEVAEYLGVTDEYFEECINDYRKQFGIYVHLGKYTLTFEPSFSIYINFEWGDNL